MQTNSVGSLRDCSAAPTPAIRSDRKTHSGNSSRPCPPRDCWNREGPTWLQQRIYEDREAELQERVDRDRVRIIHAGHGEAAAVTAGLTRFRQDVRRLGRTRPEAVVEIDTECEREEVEA